MNYDRKVSMNIGEAANGGLRYEPNCLLHPFGLLALYGLYQTVNR